MPQRPKSCGRETTGHSGHYFVSPRTADYASTWRILIWYLMTTNTFSLASSVPRIPCAVSVARGVSERLVGWHLITPTGKLFQEVERENDSYLDGCSDRCPDRYLVYSRIRFDQPGPFGVERVGGGSSKMLESMTSLVGFTGAEGDGDVLRGDSGAFGKWEKEETEGRGRREWRTGAGW